MIIYLYIKYECNKNPGGVYVRGGEGVSKRGEGKVYVRGGRVDDGFVKWRGEYSAVVNTVRINWAASTVITTSN